MSHVRCQSRYTDKPGYVCMMSENVAFPRTQLVSSTMASNAGGTVLPVEGELIGQGAEAKVWKSTFCGRPCVRALPAAPLSE